MAVIWEMSATGDRLHEVVPGWRSDAVKCCGRWTADGRTSFNLGRVSM